MMMMVMEKKTKSTLNELNDKQNTKKSLVFHETIEWHNGDGTISS